MKKLFILLLCLNLIGCSSTTQEEVESSKEPEFTTIQNKVDNESSSEDEHSNNEIINGITTSKEENSENNNNLENKDTQNTESEIDERYLKIDRIVYTTDLSQSRDDIYEDFKQHIMNKLQILTTIIETYEDLDSDKKHTYFRPSSFVEGNMDFKTKFYKTNGDIAYIYVPVTIVDSKNIAQVPSTDISTDTSSNTTSNDSSSSETSNTSKQDKWIMNSETTLNKGSFEGISDDVANGLAGYLISKDNEKIVIALNAPSSITFNGTTYTNSQLVGEIAMGLNGNSFVAWKEGTKTHTNYQNARGITYNNETKISLNKNEIKSLYKQRYEDNYITNGTQTIEDYENGIIITFTQTDGKSGFIMDSSILMKNITFKEIIDTTNNVAISFLEFTRADEAYNLTNNVLIVTYYDASTRMANISRYENGYAQYSFHNYKSNENSFNNTNCEAGWVSASSLLGITLLDYYVENK